MIPLHRAFYLNLEYDKALFSRTGIKVFCVNFNPVCLNCFKMHGPDDDDDAERLFVGLEHQSKHDFPRMPINSNIQRKPNKLYKITHGHLWSTHQSTGVTILLL